MGIPQYIKFLKEVAEIEAQWVGCVWMFAIPVSKIKWRKGYLVPIVILIFSLEF
jgi:hypothetical protein